MKKGNGVSTKLTWHCNFKLAVLAIMVFGIMIPLLIQVALLLLQSNNSSKDDVYLTSRMILYDDLEVKKSKIQSLEKHLKELEIVKMKTLQSLMQMDKKRVKLLGEIQEKVNAKNILTSEVNSYHQQVRKAKKELVFIQQTRSQRIVKNVIHVGVPIKPDNRPVESENVREFSTKESHKCTFSSCFDYSKCSMMYPFFITNSKTESSIELSPIISLLEKIPEFRHSLADQACIYLNLLKLTTELNVDIDKKQNNLIILESNGEDFHEFCRILRDSNFGNAILVMPHVCETYRANYDYILPKSLPDVTNNLWETIPPLFPVQKKYLLLFHSTFKEARNYMTAFKKDLALLQTNEKDISVELDCSVKQNDCTAGWCICDSNNQVIRDAMFVIIPLEASNPNYLENLIRLLHFGSIPVFIGSFELLPFQNTIDWRKASILLPYQRLPELVYILRTMIKDDVITLKQQGRFLYETYFSSKLTFLRTMISHIKFSIGLPPTSLKDVKALNINNETGVPKASDFSVISSSPLLQLNRNFSYIGQNLDKAWNSYPGAISMYPVETWRIPPPSEIQFLEEGKNNFMPIGDGIGGDGAAFSRSLGGDFAVEQFTVLMLTYDRQVILMEALQRLSGMKYLNKVIVVWNHPVNPAKDLQWPDIDVKIEVVRPDKNSLNNRFIPYDIIETEAILSMDDDIYLRHDEIELAFRVWRENRDRLVGFPGRHHAYNSSSGYFYYNSEHSCELSLVLTGGAFFHKYYSYLYTYKMHESIRKMVDTFMNCEDIAMNFLVSHITQKPPVKVTSRWTFRCPGCPASLSTDKDHYIERNQCMEYFQKVYGYNPLRRTQFRADSILFKTRIPSTLSKCFQFV